MRKGGIIKKKAILVLVFVFMVSMLCGGATEQWDKLPLGRLTKRGSA